MKTRKVSWLGLAALLALPVYAADSPAPAVSGATPGPVAQAPSAPALPSPHLSPNAAAVLKLSGASLGDEVILAYVKNCQSPFNLSANAILRLKEAGVTSPVIAAMLTHDASLANQDAPAPYGYNQKSYAPGEQAPVAPAPDQPAPQPQFVGPPMAPASQAPPSAPVEVVTVAPGPDYYWTPGYWGWNGGWIWIGGGWGFRGGFGWGGHYGGGYGRGGWGGYHGGGHGGGGHRR